MIAPTAGETITSGLPNWATIFSASALQSRAVRSGYWKTRFFCRNIGLWRPEARMKWPSRSAPAPRNSSRTSSVFMGTFLTRQRPVLSRGRGTENLAMAVAADTAGTAAVARADAAFFGHPLGLAYLAFMEAFERFSFYGMQALLVLYMTNRLLLPGHVEQVAGFAPFRAVIEGWFGPMRPQALSSEIFGLYAGLCSFTPVFGGLIGDRWLGQRRAVLLGGTLMAAGHFLMAF